MDRRTLIASGTAALTGAAHAAPMARRVFDYLLLGQYPSEEDMAAVSKGLASAPIGKPRMASDIGLGPQP